MSRRRRRLRSAATSMVRGRHRRALRFGSALAALAAAIVLALPGIADARTINSTMTNSGGNSPRARVCDTFTLNGVSAGTSLRLDLLGAPTGNGTLGDPYLHVFDANGREVARDDDGGTGLNSRITITWQNGYYVGASVFSSGLGATYRLTSTVGSSFTKQSIASGYPCGAPAKSNQTISFATPSARTFGATFDVSASTTSNLTITFASSNTSVCSVSNSRRSGSSTIVSVTANAAGTCTLTASQAGDASFNAASSVTRSFTINRASQTISFPTPANRTYSTLAFAISGSASSGLPVTFVSLTDDVCVLSGTQVSTLRSGTCSIRADQGGGPNHLAATSVTRSFTVSRAAQSVAFQGGTQSRDFTFSGGAQTYVVPAGVTQITVEAWGAQGGNITTHQILAGGLGGYTKGALTVTPGQVLHLYVGGKGEDRLGNHPYASCTPVDGGWNGGGRTLTAGNGTPGGGATDIRTVGGAWDSANSLNSRLLVAGGGGGGGWTFAQGGAGGSNGGTGAGETGFSSNFVAGGGAGGGGATAGGAAGQSGGSCVTLANRAGLFGRGGDGSGGSAGGGGGGGGYYGGGGGGFNQGGGGGSSFLVANASGGVFERGTNEGDGLLRITAAVVDQLNVSTLPYRPQPIPVAAVATSGLTPSITSLTTATCVAPGDGSVLLLATGTCTIRATQDGDDRFQAAVFTDRTILIELAEQTVRLDTLTAEVDGVAVDLDSVRYGDPAFDLRVETDAQVRALDGTLTNLGAFFESTTPSVCTVATTIDASGRPVGTVTTQGAGDCRLVAAHPGTDRYLPSDDAEVVIQLAARTLDITASVASRVYNGTTQPGTVTLGALTGLVDGETVRVSFQASDYTSADVGTRATTLTFALADGTGGGRAANYTLSELVVSGQITPRDVRITALPLRRTTDDPAPDLATPSSVAADLVGTVGLAVGDVLSAVGLDVATAAAPNSVIAIPDPSVVGTFVLRPKADSAVIRTSAGVDVTANHTITVATGEYAIAVGVPAATERIGGAATPQAVSGAPLAAGDQAVIRIIDAAGNLIDDGPAAEAIVTATVTTIEVDGGATGLLTGTVSVRAVGGIATFADLGLRGRVLDDDGQLISYVVTFTAMFPSSGGDVALTGATQAVRLTNAAPAALVLLAEPDFVTHPAASAEAFAANAEGRRYRIAVLDADGNVVTQGPGSTMNVRVGRSGGAVSALLDGATTAAAVAGIAEFTDLTLTGPVGTYGLRFTAGTLTAIDRPVVLGAGAPARISLDRAAAGAPADEPFATQPRLVVRDAEGNVVGAGVEVTATISATDGVPALVGATTAVTTADGRATFDDVGLIGRAGSSYRVTYEVRATSGGSVLATTSQFITVSVGPAVSLEVERAPAGGRIGSRLAVQPRLRLLDAGGNLVTDPARQLDVAATVTGLATLTGTVEVASIGGIATFTDLGLTGPVGWHHVVFVARETGTGVTIATSSSTSVALAAGAPASIEVLAPEGGVPTPAGTSGGVLATQTVRLVDAAGNTASGSTAEVTVRLLTGPTGASLSGTTTGRASAGIATFDAVTLVGPQGSYVLRFESEGLSADGPSLTLAAGDPARLTLERAAATAPVDVVLSGTDEPRFQLRDAAGTPTSVEGVTVVLSTERNDVTIACDDGTTDCRSAETDASGVATFAGLRLLGPVGDVRLTATATLVGGTVLAPVTQVVRLVAGPASQLTLERTTVGASARRVVERAPRIQLRDAAGNAVAAAGVSVTVAATPGAVTSTSTATTASDGTATFTGLAIGGTAGATHTLTYSASVGGVTLTGVTETIGLRPGAPAALVRTRDAATSGTPRVGETFATAPQVTVRDADGNTVTDANLVVRASVDGARILLGPRDAQAVGGVATFPGFGVLGTSGSASIGFSATIDGATVSATPQSVTLDPGAATNIVLRDEDGDPYPTSVTRTAGSAIATPVVVLRDVAGNETTGTLDVTAGWSPGGAFAAGVTAARTTAGTPASASFTGLTPSRAGTYRLTFSADGVSSVGFDVTVNAGVAVGLALDSRAQDVRVDAQQQFGLAEDVRVVDAFGNTVAGQATIRASIPAPLDSFTTAGATGRSGPTQAQVNTAYSGTSLADRVEVQAATPGRQEWVVPTTGDYRITVAGAQGGNASTSNVGGSGAVMTATFSLTAGQRIAIVVGQQGGSTSGCNAGGGGGSFVWSSAQGSAGLLVAAGGGGGAGSSNLGGHAQTTATAGVSVGSGNPRGTGVTSRFAAGWTADGTAVPDKGALLPPRSPLSATAPATGGERGTTSTGHGGSGGGGGGSGDSCSNWGAGGGGGYVGGESLRGDSRGGGGGGSFIATAGTEAADSRLSGASGRTGNGFVEIRALTERELSNSGSGTGQIVDLATATGTVSIAGLAIDAPSGDYPVTYQLLDASGQPIGGAFTLTQTARIVRAMQSAADGNVSVSGPGQVRLLPSGTATAPGLTVGGFGEDDVVLVSLDMVGSGAGGATFSLPTTTGLTPAFGFPATTAWAGLKDLVFTGTTANVTTALQALTVTPGSATGTQQLRVRVTTNEVRNNRQIAYNPANGHFYEFVSSAEWRTIAGVTSGTPRWEQARDAAQRADRKLKGVTGYLVTVTSQQENDFVSENIEDAASIWIGASDVGSEGQWRWMTGPEGLESDRGGTGRVFYEATCFTNNNCPNPPARYDAGGTVFGYASWATNEPNNFNGIEHYAVTNWNSTKGRWNDLPDSSTNIGGFVVEYSPNWGSNGAFSENPTLLVDVQVTALELDVLEQPDAVTLGQEFPRPVKVAVRDSDGVLRTDVAGSVTLTRAAGGATLECVGGGATCLTVSLSGGIAVFDGVRLSGQPATHRLTATATLTDGPTLTVSTTDFPAIAGAATDLVRVTEASSSRTSGDAIGTVRFNRRDAAGNLVTSSGGAVSVSVASRPADVDGANVALSGRTTVGVVGGTAEFTDLALVGPPGTYQLEFVLDGGSNVTATREVVLTGVSPSAVRLRAPPSSVANETPFDLDIELVDELGNRATTTHDVTVALAAGSLGTLDCGGACTTSVVAGQALVQALSILGPTGGTVQLVVSGVGLAPATLDVTLTGVGAPAAVVSPQGPPEMVSGSALSTVAALVVDGAGNPVDGISVTITASGATLTGTATRESGADAAATGVVVFDGLVLTGSVGTATLTFAAASTTAVALDVVLTPAVADRLLLTAGMSSGGTTVSASSGVALTGPIVVELRDPSGNPVAGEFDVSVAVTTDADVATPAVLRGTLTRRTAGGVATFSGVILDGIAGTTQTLTFSAPGLASTTTTVVMAAGPAVALDLAVAPCGATGETCTPLASGATAAVQPQVRLRDSGGNTVLATDATITLRSASGAQLLVDGSRVSEVTAAVDVTTGMATFSGVAVRAFAGTHLLEFSAPAFAGLQRSIEVTTGAAVTVELLRPAAGLVEGGTVVVAPMVRLLDDAGNVVEADGIGMTVTLTQGTGVLAGATATTATVTLDGVARAGIAVFDALRIDGSVMGEEVTLTFAAPSLTAADGVTATTSQTLRPSVGAPAALTGDVLPSGAVPAGTLFSIQPEIALVDAEGRAVGTSDVASAAGFTVRVTVERTDGAEDAVLVGHDATVGTPTAAERRTATAVTGADGVARFDGLGLIGTAGSTYRLTFSVDGSSLVTLTQDVTAAVGPAESLDLVGIPAEAASGIAFPATPLVPGVRVLDAGGNVVGDATGFSYDGEVAVRLRTNGPDVDQNARQVGPTTFPVVAGLAALEGLGLTGTDGAVSTFVVTAAGLPDVAIDVTARSGPADALRVEPARDGEGQQIARAGPAGDAMTPAPRIQVIDTGGNPVAAAGLTVTASVPIADGVLSGETAVTTDADGSATFTDLRLTAAAGRVATITFTVTATGGSDVAGVAVGLAGTESVLVLRGSPRSLVLTRAPSGARSGAPFAVQPQLELRDAFGNRVLTPGLNVTVDVTSGEASLAGTTTVPTAGDGRATFAGLGLTGAEGETVVVEFSADGILLDAGVLSAIVLTATAPSVTVEVGPAVALRLATAPSGGVSGQALATTPVVEVIDTGGNVVTGFTGDVAVSIAAVDGSTDATELDAGRFVGSAVDTPVSVTAVDGAARFPNLGLIGRAATAGTTYTLRFAVPGQGALGTVAHHVILAPGSAATFEIDRAAPSESPSGAAFATQPRIVLRDVEGNVAVASSARVTATITQVNISGVATGQLVGTTFADALAGVAEFSDLGLTGTDGTSYTITFGVAGLTGPGGANVTQTVTARTGAPTRLAFVREATGPSADGGVPQAGVLLPSGGQPRVAILDSGGNRVTSGSALDRTLVATVTPITIDGQPTGVLLNDDTQVTELTAIATTLGDDAGVATFSGLGVGGRSGVAYAITYSATVGGVPLTPVTQTIGVRAGAATRVGMLLAGSGAEVGQPFLIAPRVAVLDAFGNPVPGATDRVIATVSAGGTLVGTTSRNAVAGIATFTNLGVRGEVGENYTLSFSLPGSLAAPSTQQIRLTSGSPTRLTLHVPGAVAAPGAPLAVQPQVIVRDEAGNRAIDATLNVTAVISPVEVGGTPTGVLTGTTTVTTAAGLATFADLGVDGLVGTAYTITFTAPGMVPISQTVVVDRGAPASLGISRPSVGNVVGVAFAQQPRLAVRDAAGNLVTQMPLTVRVEVSSDDDAGAPNATLLGTTSVASVDGVAAFTDLAVVGTTGTSVTLAYRVDGYASVVAVTQTLILTTGPARVLDLVAEDADEDAEAPTLAAGSRLGVAPSLVVRDIAGNVVTTPIDVTVEASGGEVTGTTTRTSNGGTVTFTDLVVDGVPDATVRLTFRALGLTSASRVLVLTDSLPGLVPTFGTPIATPDGFSVAIANFDADYTYLGTVSLNGAVTVTAEGIVIVSGVPADRSVTLSLTSLRDGHRTVSASITARSDLAPGLTPVFRADTLVASVGGFRVELDNHSAGYAWSATATAGTASVSATGIVTVRGVPGDVTSVEVTVTTTRSGRRTSAASITGTPLPPVPAPVLTDIVRGIGGATFTIANHDPALDYTILPASATQLTVADGVATVAISGLADGQSSVVLVMVASPETFSSASAAVTVRALSAPLEPLLLLPTATADGWTLPLVNYDPAFTWTVTGVRDGDVSVPVTLVTGTDGAVSVVVSGVPQPTDLSEPAGTVSLTATTVRDGHRSATITRTLARGDGLVPRLSAPTSSDDATTLEILNYDDDFSWTVDLATSDPDVAATADVTNTAGTVSITGLGDGTAELTVTSSRPGERARSTTLLLASTFGVTPDLALGASGVDGFSVTITNVSAEETSFSAQVIGRGVAVGPDASGVVTVTGVAPGQDATVVVTSLRAGFGSVSTGIVGTALQGAARTPVLDTAVRTVDGFTSVISNYDPAWQWSPAAAAGLAEVEVLAGGGALVRVIEVEPGTATTVTVTASRDGFASGSATISGSSLDGGGRVPLFGVLSGVADPDDPSQQLSPETGFTVPIRNYDESFTWTVVIDEIIGAGAPLAGERAVIRDGIVYVNGIDAAVQRGVARITVTSSRPGRADASASYVGGAILAGVSTTDLGRVPVLGDPRPTADGYRVEIRNYDPAFLWTATSARGGVVAIDGVGRVTVTGLEPGADDVLTVRTDRFTPQHTTGNAGVAARVLAAGARTPNLLTDVTLTARCSNGVADGRGAEALNDLAETTDFTCFTGADGDIAPYVANSVGFATGDVGATIVNELVLTSGSGPAAADPMTYTLWGCLEEDRFCSVIVANDTTGLGTARRTDAVRIIRNERAFSYYRIAFGSIRGASNVVELAEVQLFGRPAVSTGIAPALRIEGAGPDGFDVAIDNFCTLCTYDITVPFPGRVSLDRTAATVSVRGLPPLTRATVTVVARRASFTDAVATIEGSSLIGPAHPVEIGGASLTQDGLRASIEGFGAPGVTWTATSTLTTTLPLDRYRVVEGRIEARFSRAHSFAVGDDVTLSGLSAPDGDLNGSWTVAALILGVDDGIVGVALVGSDEGSAPSDRAEVVVDPVATPDARLQVVDVQRFAYPADLGRAAVDGPDVTISSLGLVRVSGITAENPSTLRLEVVTSRDGHASASDAVERTWLAPALVPILTTPVATADGYEVGIENFDPAWDWRLATLLGDAVLEERADDVDPEASNWFVVVSGIGPDEVVPLTVGTTRTGYRSGGAVTPTATSRALPVVVPARFGEATLSGERLEVVLLDPDLAAVWTADWADQADAAADADATVEVVSIGGEVRLIVEGFADAASVPDITVTGTRAGVSATSVWRAALGATLTPEFGPVTLTADGFTVRILNYDEARDWQLVVTPASSARSLDAAGLVTVSGIASGATTTLQVITTAPFTQVGVASLAVARDALPGLVPALTGPIAVTGGFTLRIANYDPAYRWSVEVDGVELLGQPSDGGFIAVGGVEPGVDTTVTVRSSRDGFATASASRTGRAQPRPGRVPTFGVPEVNTQGFRVDLANFGASGEGFTWSASADNGARATIDSDGLVRVTEAPGFTPITVVVTTERDGYRPEVANLTVTTLPSPALVPQFGISTSTGDGYTVMIRNHDPRWTYVTTTGCAASCTFADELTVTAVAREDGTVTLWTAVSHALRAGDRIVVSGIDRVSPAISGVDSGGQLVTITAVAADGTTFSYEAAGAELTRSPVEVTLPFTVTRTSSASVSADGLLTVRGVWEGEFETVTVRTQRVGSTDGEAQFAAAARATATTVLGLARIVDARASERVATLSTLLDHGLAIGETVEILVSGLGSDFDGFHTAVATGARSVTFPHGIPTAGRSAATVVATSDGEADGEADTFTVLTAGASLGRATLVTSEAHGFAVGDTVLVAGAGPTFDGLRTLVAVDRDELVFDHVIPLTTFTPPGFLRTGADLFLTVQLSQRDGPQVSVGVTVPFAVAESGTIVDATPAMTEVVDLGYRVVSVVAVAPDGSNVSELNDQLRILFDPPAEGAVPVTSEDGGVTWQELPRLDVPDLPPCIPGEPCLRDGYWIDDDGNVWILTRHLSMFGLLARQAFPILLTADDESLLRGDSTSVSVSGGEGDGELTVAMRTPDVCVLDPDDMTLTSVRGGICILEATRAPSGRFLAASTTLSLTVFTAQGVPLALSTPSGTLTVGTALPVTVTGGEGTGAVTLSSSTPATCAVDSASRTVTGIAPGGCTIQAVKAAAEEFLVASTTFGLTVVAAPLPPAPTPLPVVGPTSRPSAQGAPSGATREPTAEERARSVEAVLLDDAVREEVRERGAVAIVDDTLIDVIVDVVRSEQSAQFVVRGDGFEVTVAALDVLGNGVDIVEGRLVVSASTVLVIEGTGYLAGSTVRLWLFSSPAILGDVLVDAGGDFRAEVGLPEGVELGGHTLQINGLSADGRTRSISIARNVVEDADLPLVAPAPGEAAPGEAAPGAGASEEAGDDAVPASRRLRTLFAVLLLVVAAGAVLAVRRGRSGGR